ncbi:MAG: NACHT domain-containing protein, partial [Gammaproteobacteria bacterium]|nr:NACHT domain-containing protein [Gammaproteobacteria bacterium]
MKLEHAPNRWLRPPEGEGAEALAELAESIRMERATFLLALIPDDRIRFGITEKENLYTREIRAETTRRLIGQFRFAALDVRSGLPPREHLAAIPAPGAPRAIVFWSGFEALEQAARLELIHSLNLSREALRASGAQMVFLLTREAYAAFSEQALDLMAWAPPPIRFEPDLILSTPLGEQPYPLLIQQLTTIHELSAHVFSGRMDGSKAVLAADLAKRLTALNLREPASEVLQRVARFHSERRHTGKLERLYLDYVVDRYQRLDVFSIIEDAPITVELARAYVKLKVERSDDGESATHRARSGEEPERKNERQLALLEGRGEPREMEAEAALNTHPRLVILGAPGSGKTTLLKYLALTAARAEANAATRKLPFLVSAAALARELRESNELFPHLPELLSRVFQRLAPWLGLNADFFSQVLNQGRGLLLIDGLDEVANAQDRQQVVALIQAAAGQWRECQWVLSSRPHGFQSVAGQGLPGFALAQVQPLDDAGRADFVQGWYLAVETAARGDSPATRETARSTADKLIAAIQAARGVRELASNPLLLGVLALVHRRNVTLPQRRTELYDE